MRRWTVACRAAVYGALVPAARFRPKNGPEEKRESLGRANSAKFLERLCRYPKGSDAVAKAALAKTVTEAQRHILEAHADRLTNELVEGRQSGTMPAWIDEFHFTGERVTYEDIVDGRAPRPRVLDMFAGGGAIPLEALRLGHRIHVMSGRPARLDKALTPAGLVPRAPNDSAVLRLQGDLLQRLRLAADG